jgi:hypothetical protein
MPRAIQNPVDQRFFSDGLDAVDVIVHGHNSHEQQPHSPQRRRLVMTRRISALAPYPGNPNARLWNPGGATLEEACASLGVAEGTVAIIGGTEPFGLFLPRYELFHLSRAAFAHIPEGRPVFPGIPPDTPEQILQRHGLHADLARVLDADAGVSVTTWRR